jgi:micrococcal nuclease
MNKQLVTLIFCLLLITGGFLLVDSPFQNYLGRNVPAVKSAVSKNLNGIQKAKVVKISDGDTIVLDNGQKVRYLYIDTPETVKEGVPIQCFGPEAKEMNTKLVLGKEVWLWSDKESKDQYDRELRLVFLAGENPDDPSKSVNALLVKGGFARARIFKPNTTFENDFKEYEKNAKTKKLGVWGVCSDPFVK